MSKNIHFTGQPLFTQLLSLTDKQHIYKISRQGDFDRLSWGIIITAAALGLTVLGSDTLLNAISNFLIIISLPFSFFYGWQLCTFLRQLIKERRKLRKQKRPAE